MAMQDPRYPDGYHGWTNRETWATYLWLSNDPAAYGRAVKLAREGRRTGGGGPGERRCGMAMQDPRYPDGYHGWTNRETWVIYLWLSNDSAAYGRAVELARKSLGALRDWVEEWITPKEASPASDMVSVALEWVNWEEIRQALLEE